MRSSIFPPNFPQKLAEVAFVHGDEAAWQQSDSLAAISWLAENNYAILGFDLWLTEKHSIRTAIATRAGPAIYAFDRDRMKAEAWEDYVRRSTQEASRAIAEFQWPLDALEPPRPVYFNLCWADAGSFAA